MARHSPTLYYTKGQVLASSSTTAPDMCTQHARHRSCGLMADWLVHMATSLRAHLEGHVAYWNTKLACPAHVCWVMS